MAVMAREEWTDERLDDLRSDMNRRFVEVKGEIREVKAEVRDLRGEMNARFIAVDARFDAMQRTLILGFGSIVASVIGGLLATQL
ncbi:MAG TPA: hypothetical protein VFN92_08345 [Solirubrobacterales bacterium]|nr:hypothetical protein [Solirubrobacterales bacterium]